MELIIAIIGIAVLLGVKINGKASNINYEAKIAESKRRQTDYQAICGIGFPSYTTIKDALIRKLLTGEFTYDEVLNILHNDLCYIFGEDYKSALASKPIIGGKNPAETRKRANEILIELLLSIGGYIYDDAIVGYGMIIPLSTVYSTKYCQVIERHLKDNYPNNNMSMFNNNGALTFSYVRPYSGKDFWTPKPYDSFYSPKLRQQVREHIQSALADPSVQNGTYGLQI